MEDDQRLFGRTRATVDERERRRRTGPSGIHHVLLQPVRPVEEGELHRSRGVEGREEESESFGDPGKEHNKSISFLVWRKTFALPLQLEVAREELMRTKGIGREKHEGELDEKEAMEPTAWASPGPNG